MFFLQRARETLDRMIPGLAERLNRHPLEVLESPGNPGVGDFQACGGPALMIPARYAGKGATPLEACQVQQAIGAVSPSLAVATMMHHFSAATLVEIAAAQGSKTWVVLEMVARDNLLMASGFAEGGSGANILRPFTRLIRKGSRYCVSGSKKPCSLAHSMDLLTLSVLVPGEAAGDERLAVAVLPASAPGLERRAFWNSPILAGAESDEVILNEVPLSERSLAFAGRPGELDEVQTVGFLWFVLLCTSSYLGAAANLAEKVFAQNRGSSSDRTRLAIELEGAHAAMEGLASRIAGPRGTGVSPVEHRRGADATHGCPAGHVAEFVTSPPDSESSRIPLPTPRDEHLLAHALLVRYSIQQALERATSLAVELLGGLGFMASGQTAYLSSAVRALAFHPPSRTSMSEALALYLGGEPLRFAPPPLQRAA
jgi:alkylation response protein AidB-like acyl-CoA dehydrogenase